MNIEVTPTITPQIPASLRLWVFVSAGSWLLGSAVGQLISTLFGSIIDTMIAMPPPTENSPDFRLGQGLVVIFLRLIVSALLGGLALGVITGTLQMQFLRAHRVSSRQWLLVSTVSWCIVNSLDAIRNQILWQGQAYIPALGFLLVSIAVLSLAFWLVLRHYFVPSWKWIGAGVIGYVMATLLTVLPTTIALAAYS